MSSRPSLGRIVPPDWEHVVRYPLRGVPVPPGPAERVLADSKTWWPFYDQGSEGACVGFGSSRMMSILNRRRYSGHWLYRQCKAIDGYPGEDGTTVRAAMDVLRAQGHERVVGMRETGPYLSDGISENRWATTLDEVRMCLAAGIPVVIGVNWYTDFDTPVKSFGMGGRWQVGTRSDIGSIRGGHCVCLVGVSDKYEQVAFANSWGSDYPRRTWMPYHVFERLMAEDGEATLVIDRV